MSPRLVHEVRLLLAVLGLLVGVIGWFFVRGVLSGRGSHARPHAAVHASAPQALVAGPAGRAPARAFTLSGRGVEMLLPGGPSVPVDLVIENPAAAPLALETITTRIASTSRPGCATSNFAVAQQLAAEPVVPGHATRSLAQLGVPRSQWPQLRMRETGAEQNACQGAELALAFDGTGRYGR